MSFLTRRILRPQNLSLQPASQWSRPFGISSAIRALSESDHSEHPEDPERKAKIDHHKDDGIRKQREGKGQWKKELSSNSEAAIKADREETEHVERDIEALQRQTSEAMQDEHEHGKK